MAEASAHKLSFVRETTRGVTPTNPRFIALPDTRTTLALTKENLTSERITGDRFPAVPRSGADGVGGDIPADLSAGAYDDFIESALQGAFVADPANVNDMVDLEVDGLARADKEEGFESVTANGTVVVERLDSKAEIVVFRFDPTVAGPSTNHVVEGLSSVTIDSVVFEVIAYEDGIGSHTAKAGDTRLSFSVLREFSDLEVGSKPFMLFRGVEVATWNLTAAANAIAKSTFTLWGRGMDGPNENAPTNSSVAPSIDTEPFDTFTGSLEIDGVPSAIVTDYNFTINNNHAPRFVVGFKNSQDASVGQAVVEGSLTVYFNNTTLLEKFISQTSFSITLTLQDTNGNQYVVKLPNLKIGNGTQPDVSGDGPLTLPINFTGHRDSTEGTHLSVQRIYPLAV